MGAEALFQCGESFVGRADCGIEFATSAESREGSALRGLNDRLGRLGGTKTGLQSRWRQMNPTRMQDAIANLTRRFDKDGGRQSCNLAHAVPKIESIQLHPCAEKKTCRHTHGFLPRWMWNGLLERYLAPRGAEQKLDRLTPLRGRPMHRIFPPVRSAGIGEEVPHMMVIREQPGFATDTLRLAQRLSTTGTLREGAEQFR